jgi:hypothetical protein
MTSDIVLLLFKMLREFHHFGSNCTLVYTVLFLKYPDWLPAYINKQRLDKRKLHQRFLEVADGHIRLKGVLK